MKSLKIIQKTFSLAHGAAGLSQDFPMAGFMTWARILRLADGPDEVHVRAVSRIEMKK